MRIAGNITDKKLRKEQFDSLVDVIDLIKTKDELKLFLESFLSESEKAYLGQRLNIMRMLSKNFNYQQIKEKINASGATITNAQKCLDCGAGKLEEIILQYKFKKKNQISEIKRDNNPFRTHYPGSIIK